MPSVDLKSEYWLHKKGGKSCQEEMEQVLQVKDQEPAEERVWEEGAVEEAV